MIANNLYIVYEEVFLLGCSLPLIGAMIGFLIFNIPGAILGALIGYLFEGNSGGTSRRYSYSSRNLQQQEFYKNLFGLLAVFAQGDGTVSREEIEIVDHFVRHELNLSEQDRKMAIKFFDQAKRNGYDLKHYAENIAKLVRYNPNILNSIMNLLFRLSDANGGPSQKQEEFLDELQFVFRLSHDRNYRNSSYQGRRTGSSRMSTRNRLKEAYETLNLEPDADKSQVKKKYRELAKKYHPDKIIAKDLPDEFVEMAKEKFTEIQAAYEEIMKNKRSQ